MPDPFDSADPVVRSVAARYAALAAEAARIDSSLRAYAARPGSMASSHATVPALRHYTFVEGSECGCDVCSEWDLRRAEFVDSTGLVPRGHKWSTCDCGVCRFVGRIHLNFLAATNTRDLLIETSYHARHHSPFGDKVMAWLEKELRDPRYTANWRAQEMSRYPLEWWFRRCEGELGPLVSGAVFRETMHVNDARVHFSSSLGADGFVSV